VDRTRWEASTHLVLSKMRVSTLRGRPIPEFGERRLTLDTREGQALYDEALPPQEDDHHRYHRDHRRGKLDVHRVASQGVVAQAVCHSRQRQLLELVQIDDRSEHLVL